jgi:hypothetical protein
MLSRDTQDAGVLAYPTEEAEVTDPDVATKDPAHITHEIAWPAKEISGLDVAVPVLTSRSRRHGTGGRVT